MKVTIKTHFAAKVQATQFNPVEQNDGIEVELEVKDEQELEEQYEKYQKFIRERVVKSTMQGVREIVAARAQMLSELDDED